MNLGQSMLFSFYFTNPEIASALRQVSIIGFTNEEKRSLIAGNTKKGKKSQTDRYADIHNYSSSPQPQNKTSAGMSTSHDFVITETITFNCLKSKTDILTKLKPKPVEY